MRFGPMFMEIGDVAQRQLSSMMELIWKTYKCITVLVDCVV